MENMFGEGLKKIILMGIGAAAVTAEKSQQVVEELVKKGEITVEQGKELNQELKRNVKKSFEDAVKAGEEVEAEAAAETAAKVDEMEKKISDMTVEELENLKAMISKAEEAVKGKEE